MKHRKALEGADPVCHAIYHVRGPEIASQDKYK